MAARDELVDAMALAIQEELADEGQWHEAVAFGLHVAVRDHLEALSTFIVETIAVEAADKKATDA